LVDEGPSDAGVESTDVTPDHGGSLRATIGDFEGESVELVVYYPAVKFEQIDLRRALICLEMDGGIEFERGGGIVKIADVDRTAQYIRELENLGIVPHPCVEEKVMKRLVNELAGAYVRRPACVVLFHGGGGVVHEIFNLVANGVRVVLVALPEHVHDACSNRDGLTILDPKSLGWCYPPRSDDEWRERGEDHA
jgi:hypothetical protein